MIKANLPAMDSSRDEDEVVEVPVERTERKLLSPNSKRRRVKASLREKRIFKHIRNPGKWKKNVKRSSKSKRNSKKNDEGDEGKENRDGKAEDTGEYHESGDMTPEVFVNLEGSQSPVVEEPVSQVQSDIQFLGGGTTDKNQESTSFANAEHVSKEIISAKALKRFHKPDPFPSDLHSSRKYEAWLFWKQQFHVAVELSGETNQRSMANYVMISAGEEIRRLVFTMKLLPEISSVAKDFPFYDNMMTKLEAHFKGTSDLTVDLGAFSAMSQEHNEGVRDFHMRLLRQAVLCGLTDQKALIKGRFIDGMKDKEISRRAYSENWDLEKIVNVASRNEAAESLKPRGWTTTPKVVEVAAVTGKTRGQRKRGPPPFVKKAKPGENKGRKRCPNCALIHDENVKCPAKDKKCMDCNKLGHFRAACPLKVQEVEATDDKKENKIAEVKNLY